MSKTTVAIAFAALLLSGCGSVIRKEFLTNDTRDFDFHRPPDCGPEPTEPQNAVAVRYLGSGGAAISWRGDTILLGPYFSHAGSLVTAQFGHVHFDQKRIADGLADVDTANVRAIITGHSHFDHYGDVPEVAERTKSATIYTNASGLKMLAAYPSLLARAKSVEYEEGKWIRISGRLRVMPVLSEHAPQLCRWNHFPCTYAPGEVPAAFTAEWPEQRMRSLRGGKTFAYVIDLLGTSDEVRFRIYYNDSAAGPRVGIPPESIKAEHPDYDLAILCMASYDHVTAYPETILSALQPRHVLVSHYDDFFRKQEGGLTFPPLLTNRKANRFMKRMRDALHHFPTAPKQPEKPVCGPMTAQWSMPVPQWPLYFVP